MSQSWEKIKPDSEINKFLIEFTNILRTGYVEIGEDKTVMPSCYIDIARDIENFEIRNTDIFVASYLKTGTTWCQEMTWMTYNLDYEGAKIDLKERFPYLEFTGIHEFNSKELLKKYPDFPQAKFVNDSVNYVKELKDNPRFIKTHLPWSLLPKDILENETKPKIIYIVRNPKDTCVSFYHHCRLLEGYTGTFENFCELFLGDKLHYAPFWKHVIGYWNRRNQPNVLFLRYEDLKKDLKTVIKQLAKFLEKELNEDDIVKLMDHLSFDSMKNNDSVNNEKIAKVMRKVHDNGSDNETFIRSGKVGSYKAEMTPEIIKMFDIWTEENIKGTGLDFMLHK